jgi:hypothetical protein
MLNKEVCAACYKRFFGREIQFEEQIWCYIFSPRYVQHLPADSKPPMNCPYALEQTMTQGKNT